MQTNSALLCEDGFQAGKSNGAIFYNASTDVRVLCHGDDFAILGDVAGRQKFKEALSKRYVFKVLACLGFGKDDSREATFLNRVITVQAEARPRSITYEPDARHAQLLCSQLGLERGKPVETPAEHRSAERQVLDSKAPSLPEEQKKVYRSCVMRAAYLAQDDPSISEAVKGLSRSMSSPNESDWTRLKRLGRYLLRYPMTANVFVEQPEVKMIRVFCDSDHAGCGVTRRSTTGLATMLGRHCVRHSSNMQSTIGLSSGESEWYALVAGASVGLALQSLLADWGVKLELTVLSDSSAARGFSSRQGLGKMRHVQTRFLWAQERVKSGDLKVEPVRGKSNVADLFTKPVNGVLRERLLKKLGFVHIAPGSKQKQLL